MKRDLIARSEQFDKIVRNARKTLYKWGYKEVYLPTLIKWGEGLRRGLKFVHCNEIYLIKPDVTSQIFRSVTPDKKETKRVFYISEILDNNVKGNFQFGIEIINGENSETEIIFVILSILYNLGIKDFYIDIGSLNVWKNIIQTEEQWNTVLKALKDRDFETIESSDFNKDTKEKLWFLFNYRGKISSYKKLNKIIENIKDDRLYIDFGTMRPLTYYDDIVFEIYSEYSGKPIGGGGNYTFRNGVKGVGVGLNLSVLSNISEISEAAQQTRTKPSSLHEAYESVLKGENITLEK